MIYDRPIYIALYYMYFNKIVTLFTILKIFNIIFLTLCCGVHFVSSNIHLILLSPLNSLPELPFLPYVTLIYYLFSVTSCR